jgi:hypothetical protein
LVVVLVGIGLATALASNALNPAPSAAHMRAPAPGSAVAQLSQAASASFGVFGQPPGGSEDVRLVREVVGGDKALALDPASVRLAQSSNSIEVFVAGDSKSVCVVGRIPGGAMDGGCGSEAAAANPATPGIGTMAYPPGAVSHPGGRLAVTALFPDGTTDVTVTSSSGDVEPVGIVNNTVAFIAGEASTLSWTGPEGHAYSSPLPH